MTKHMRNNKNRKSYFLKDRALIKFILSHSKIQKIDFSKVKIPSLSDFLKNKHELNYFDDINILFLKKVLFKDKDNKILENKNLPIFNLSFKQVNLSIKNNNEYKINSFLFE